MFPDVRRSDRSLRCLQDTPRRRCFPMSNITSAFVLDCIQRFVDASASAGFWRNSDFDLIYIIYGYIRERASTPVPTPTFFLSGARLRNGATKENGIGRPEQSELTLQAKTLIGLMLMSITSRRNATPGDLARFDMYIYHSELLGGSWQSDAPWLYPKVRGARIADHSADSSLQSERSKR